MSLSARTTLFAALAMAAATNASAADLTTYQAPDASAYDRPSAFQWSGAYFGAHGGIASPKLNPFASGKGLTGGVQAGYNFQVGPGILGAELEGSYLGNNEIRVPNGKVEERFRGAVKAKAGLTFDRTLVYGTAGLTMTKFEGGRGVSAPGGWKQGYLFGGGIEQGFGGGLSAKIEYNYVMTNDVSTTTSAGKSKTDVHDHVIKAGLNYRF
ncbi:MULTISPECIES: outer membrane beta-barrel protein [unclassified Rhizobium]|uniref:outer membrane protein n=1 Tax=unclassified Rhizobium TaxID=2613769 RepID=UPI000EA92200|nr:MULTISPECIES: outer membrane beta-barrel protein [unclassified Rhizobium]AYG64655.1 porin family protein [Rhizobium sp. CCGE531]AYG71137.1 porin family protein [Rhizobium sp. CCGE532]